MRAETTTRDQIVEAADWLFYQRGYEHTSFADIAGTVRISRGNFYYHFKSKDDILNAVIEARLANTRRMLERWEEEEAHPSGRIRRFIQIVVTNQANIESYGCPVGTLTTELAKLGHPSRPGAVAVFTLFREWLREQFAALVAETEAEADELAMRVLSFSQGVATLANAFHDQEFVWREVARMCDWLDSFTVDRDGELHETATSSHSSGSSMPSPSGT